MSTPSPLARLITLCQDDPVGVLLGVLCFVIYGAIVYMRPRWRAMDEAGHLDAERKRAQLAGKR